MIELCFIIPTYNRLNKLIKNIKQINQVFSGQGINYLIFLIDNSSEQQTFNHFNSNHYDNLIYFKREEFAPNGNISIHKVFLETKINSKLYWWFGDDDYILPHSIEVIKYILTNNKIQYLHATDLTIKLADSNIIDYGSKILSHYGILELTSFMSSQIFTKKIFDEINIYLTNEFVNLDWRFNFNHAIMISNIIWDEVCMISEKGMVVAQNHIDEPEDVVNNSLDNFYQSINGWFTITENINKLLNDRNLSPPLNPNLLLYRKKPIWEHYIKWMINYLSFTTNANVVQDLKSIKSILNLCGIEHGFQYDLINVMINLEKLRNTCSNDLTNKSIIPFYQSIYTKL